LINNPDGLRWLQSLDIIWIGGSMLPKDLADKARRKSIKLAPCYGTTETVAMVTCLSPKDFLKGSDSVGFLSKMWR
jgi:O-succinylbenzoic acid--CoA ligase